MGLDMHLYRSPIKEKVNDDSLWERSDEVAYWRKANHIHNWFVKTLQGGVDDCRQVKVKQKHLLKLLKLCKKVLSDRCEETSHSLLPTRSGFFFGGTDYGEGYYWKVEHTIEMLEKILSETDWNKQFIWYGSSW